MNILTEQLPTAIEVNDKIYDLNTDFRNCLKIIIAFEDNELAEIEKCSILINLLYTEVPKNVDEALRLGIKFLNCGEEGENANTSNLGRLYSFEKDSKYIYSAIKQSHNIDLEQIEYLHWWKFVYMFLDLNENCFFNKIIYLRKQKKLGKLNKEEREVYCNMIDILELPKDYNHEEQRAVDDFLKNLNTEG